MALKTPQEWQKFDRDGETKVRRKLEQGLYRPERAKQAQAWLASVARGTPGRETSEGKKQPKSSRAQRRRRRLSGLRAFLSYFHADRRLAGRIKGELQRFGIAVFLAHEDIDPSHEWQEEILRELDKCHLFLPLLTRRFHGSRWTDQETGLAIAKRKVIIPLSVGVNPYGFAGRFQAFVFRRGRLARSCLQLLHTIRANGKLRSRALNCLINAFRDSVDFNDSRDKSELLLESGPLSKAQANEVIRVSADNDQIYNCTPTVKNLKRFIRRNRKNISPLLLEKYEKKKFSG